MQATFSHFLPLAALILTAVRLGGGLYECLLIDRAWPKNVSLIQPSRGGIDRKIFWMPAHFAFEVTLIASIWAAWPNTAARTWLLVAAASHVLLRVWSALYFIPRAIEFARAKDLTPDLRARAERWVRLSVGRVPLDMVTLLALCFAISAFVYGP